MDVEHLQVIRTRDARDHGIPWSGPQAEIAQEFVTDRHDLLIYIDELEAENTALRELRRILEAREDKITGILEGEHD